MCNSLVSVWKFMEDSQTIHSDPSGPLNPFHSNFLSSWVLSCSWGTGSLVCDVKVTIEKRVKWEPPELSLHTEKTNWNALYLLIPLTFTIILWYGNYYHSLLLMRKLRHREVNQFSQIDTISESRFHPTQTLGVFTWCVDSSQLRCLLPAKDTKWVVEGDCCKYQWCLCEYCRNKGCGGYWYWGVEWSG